MSTAIVCGGRDYNDKATMGAVLAQLRVSADITHIVVGACRGADLLAAEWARSRGIPCALEPVTAREWKERGKAAGPIRNRRMLHKYTPDLVIAFPGHAGTADMVSQAKKANVMVALVSPEGAVQWL